MDQQPRGFLKTVLDQELKRRKSCRLFEQAAEMSRRNMAFLRLLFKIPVVLRIQADFVDQPFQIRHLARRQFQGFFSGFMQLKQKVFIQQNRTRRHRPHTARQRNDRVHILQETFGIAHWNQRIFRVELHQPAFNIPLYPFPVGTDEVMVPRTVVDGTVFKKCARMRYECICAFHAEFGPLVDPQTQRPLVVELNPVIKRHIADCRPVFRHTSRKTEMMAREKYHLRIPDVRFI